jgi:hypothetical protein
MRTQQQPDEEESLFYELTTSPDLSYPKKIEQSSVPLGPYKLRINIDAETYKNKECIKDIKTAILDVHKQVFKNQNRNNLIPFFKMVKSEKITHPDDKKRFAKGTQVTLYLSKSINPFSQTDSLIPLQDFILKLTDKLRQKKMTPGEVSETDSPLTEFISFRQDHIFVFETRSYKYVRHDSDWAKKIKEELQPESPIFKYLGCMATKMKYFYRQLIHRFEQDNDDNNTKLKPTNKKKALLLNKLNEFKTQKTNSQTELQQLRKHMKSALQFERCSKISAFFRSAFFLSTASITEEREFYEQYVSKTITLSPNLQLDKQTDNTPENESKSNSTTPKAKPLSVSIQATLNGNTTKKVPAESDHSSSPSSSNTKS